MTTRVKICGITRPEDAALAAELGADAIGLNFFAGPRKITTDQAHAILESLPELVTPVALLGKPAADAPTAYELWSDHNLVTFQIYDRSEAAKIRCSNIIGCKVWSVIHVHSRQFCTDAGLVSEDRNLGSDGPQLSAMLVLDTASQSGQLGGTGKSFNWHWIAEAREAGELEGLPPIILAGGLTPHNVAEAIRIARPYAVDVSSGVEIPGKPGIKDPVKMRDFIQAAKNAL